MTRIPCSRRFFVAARPTMPAPITHTCLPVGDDDIDGAMNAVQIGEIRGNETQLRWNTEQKWRVGLKCYKYIYRE